MEVGIGCDQEMVENCGGLKNIGGSRERLGEEE